jgi:cytochrome c oxidase assembly protein subunit 15
MRDAASRSDRLQPDGVAAVRRRCAQLAIVAAALTFVVIVASAFMRHVQAGLSCADWPACYALAAGAGDAQIAGVGVARGVHRLAASGAALLVLAMLLVAWRHPPSRRWAVSALGIVAALAALGVATPGARLPAVALANLLGGFALLATLTAAHAHAGDLTMPSARVRAAAAMATALALLQAAIGGSIAAQSALLACPTLPGCDDLTWSAFFGGGAWNPWHAPSIASGRFVAPPGAAALHVLHRITGMLLMALVLAIAARLWQPRGVLAVALGLALSLVIAGGIAAALVPSSLGATLLHNASAALLVALLARAAVAPTAATATQSTAYDDRAYVPRQALD